MLDLLDPQIQKTADSAEVIRVINLAFLCLEFYPEKRPTMSEAVSMLQGIIDVTLYKSGDIGNSPSSYRANSPHGYTPLLPSLDSTSEEHPSDSFDISTGDTTSGTTNPGLEMRNLSGR